MELVKLMEKSRSKANLNPKELARSKRRSARHLAARQSEAEFLLQVSNEFSHQISLRGSFSLQRIDRPWDENSRQAIQKALKRLPGPVWQFACSKIGLDETFLNQASESGLKIAAANLLINIEEKSSESSIRELLWKFAAFQGYSKENSSNES